MNRRSKFVGAGAGVECLERRRLLSGNVTAFVDGGGNLNIYGDIGNNGIDCQQVAGGRWKISPFNNTKVNGVAKPFITDPVIGDIYATMDGGADDVSFHDGSVPGSLTVNMGENPDTADLWNLKLGTFLHFEGNAGADSVLVRDMAIAPNLGYYSSIDTHEGPDKVSVDHFTDDWLEITTGDGVDYVKITNTKLTDIGAGGFLYIATGAGSDGLELHRVGVEGLLQVSMGDGGQDYADITDQVKSFSHDLDGGAQGGDELYWTPATLGTGPSPTNWEILHTY
jgi:hypothetical protein